jgi:hypothetical protein
MTKKYELTDETITLPNGQTARRIKALVDIGDDVKSGDIGGYIEKPENLSQEGNAWVFGNAKVSGNADYYCAFPVGSRNDVITFYRTEQGISVCCGCWKGTIDEFAARVETVHGDNDFGKEYRLQIEIAKLRIKTTNSPEGGKENND